MRREVAIEKVLTRAKTPVSYIRLRGRWLRDLGFVPGARATIRATGFGTLELQVLVTGFQHPPTTI